MQVIENKGFVRLVDFMGGDLRVVQAARVSFGATPYNEEERNRRLINYLLEHGHETPFEKSVFEFHIKAPIFVARQWFRHRIGSFSEVSGRYTKFKEDEYYLPEKIRIQDVKNKQGSLTTNFSNEIESNLIDIIKNSTEASIRAYNTLLERGVARELARIVLPLNIYTQFYWTVNARSLMNFLCQRLDPHAQFEIREYAKAILEIFKEKMPITHEAFNRLKLSCQ